MIFRLVCWTLLLKFWWLLKEPFGFSSEGNLLLASLFGFLWKKNSLYVGENTSLSNSDPTKEFVQLFVIPDGELKMSWDNSGLLVVPCSVAGKLKDLSGQVLENGCHVNWSARTDSLRVVSFTQKTVYSANWKLKSSSR